MIKFRHKGDFSNTEKYLKRIRKGVSTKCLEKYASEGVTALSAATPSKTGFTASMWGYKIEQTNHRIRICFTNDNIQEGVPIAIVLQLGHGTGSGGWVEGRDYINPAIQPIFDKIAENAWREVTSS